MDSVISPPNVDDYESDIDECVREIQRRPLVDILVAIMLINDLFCDLSENC